MPIAAVILAGGEGSRLGGVVKATIEIGGLSLLDRVAAALRGTATPILVARGRIDPARLGLASDLLAIPDLESDYRGPIAGLAAAVDWLDEAGLQPEFLLSVAVDTPFFPPRFAQGALAIASTSGTSVVLATYDGQDYPTNALWRRIAIADLPRRLRDGTAPRSLKGLAVSIGAERLPWPVADGGDPFSNVNTPQDLVALSLRARTESSA